MPPILSINCNGWEDDFEQRQAMHVLSDGAMVAIRRRSWRKSASDWTSSTANVFSHVWLELPSYRESVRNECRITFHSCSFTFFSKGMKILFRVNSMDTPITMNSLSSMMKSTRNDRFPWFVIFSWSSTCFNSMIPGLRHPIIDHASFLEPGLPCLHHGWCLPIEFLLGSRSLHNDHESNRNEHVEYNRSAQGVRGPRCLSDAKLVSSRLG